ncbi:MAG: COX15/CtaA family protein [Gammaproteobacteria bacterium]
MDRRPVAVLAFCATLFSLGVIALGAFTRLIDAGLGCPDWPGCYGHLTVPMTTQALHSVNLLYPHSPLIAYKALAEMIHRYFVGGLSLFILTIVGIIFAKSTYRIRSNVILAICLILLLIYQILLGQWTVTLKLLPIIVTQHLLGGFLILSILWIIYLNNSYTQRIQTYPRIILPLAIIALLLVLLQILLGAWTSTNYASLSCPDFPFCVNDNPGMLMHFKEAFNLMSPVGINYEGGVLPAEIRQTIQMTHRVGALILTLYLFGFLIFAMQKLKKAPELMKLLYLMMGLLCVQLCIGISNVVFKLPLITAIAHNLIAVILLLSIITFTFRIAILGCKVPNA